MEMRSPQHALFPLSINQLSTGKFRYHGISLRHFGQKERLGSLTLIPRGMRYITTFRNDPMQMPNSAKHSGITHAFSAAMLHSMMFSCSCMPCILPYDAADVKPNI